MIFTRSLLQDPKILNHYPSPWDAGRFPNTLRHLHLGCPRWAKREIFHFVYRSPLPEDQTNLPLYIGTSPILHHDRAISTSSWSLSFPHICRPEGLLEGLTLRTDGPNFCSLDDHA